ncbi:MULTISPECIES: sigma-54-dependent Fis family transcriptional regulator [unclassified Bradyrhizobium]|uniref:sigma-54-dependent Fis family transcriptional regulator n=1 Tax=unclassified Bradyrhizobium TaxID=2631580 RepID=UPI0020B25DD6|nr:MULTISPECIES: sigma-54-dependent Fis family transcriptional regulator [unclassified Bradyrhizobium]MCP3380644.1 sigma 54-interacting transcriptional regulator [Bradyrhizobium sp. CCGUVB4N]MCP3441514.1 sigma 54-interacting transcriptional regulator [Bradyrhizobium sp. CCGUVB14]
MAERETRISLAEASRRAARILTRGASSELETGAAPTFNDLAESLHFALGDGRIWLNDQRMVLMQSQVLGRLRCEIIDAFGVETARALFTRVGYMQGMRDAELIQKRFPNEDLTHALAAGPRVHTLEGFVKVTTRHFEFDRDKCTYFGEFLWEDSSEAAEHLASYGLASEPVCWLQVGYPSGYTSKLCGWPVIFREVECAGMGAPRCVVVGQHADAWGEDAPERSYFGLEWKSRPAHAVGKTAAAADQSPPPSGDDSTVAVGVSAAFVRTRRQLERVAATDATVLFVGESGVGKELFSSQLHAMSRRNGGPFVAINCAAIPEQLVESELFGVEKGAYTGAIASRAGYFERASGGTLFLDEIASLTYSAQGKVLRALQERKIERVGGSKTISLNVRVVAASNVDLTAEVAAGRFRQDLYFRLCVFPILIPPLRERRDDIPLLMAHFLGIYCARHDRHLTGFSRRATDALLKYDYPGNIRELQNLIERGVVYADDGGIIDISHLFSGSELLPPFSIQLTSDGRLGRTPLLGLDPSSADERDTAALNSGASFAKGSFAEMEAAAYRSALTQTDGNVSAAARLLKISRPKLDYRLRRLGL